MHPGLRRSVPLTLPVPRPLTRPRNQVARVHPDRELGATRRGADTLAVAKRAPKARLGEGRIQLDGSSSGRAALQTNGSSVIRTHRIKDALHRRATRVIAGTVILTVGLAAATYLILASTVLFVAPGNVHHAVVQRGAYTISQIPAGAVMYVSTDPVDTSMPTHLKQAWQGAAGGSVVRIVAGPNGKLTTRHGDLVLNGKDTGYSGNADPTLLANEYVALCLSGHCTVGDTVLVPQANVVGAVKGYLTWHGITNAEQP